MREKNKWEVLTDKDKFQSDNVIIATGYARNPIRPLFDEKEAFKGEIIHSSEYKNGERYKNKKVLVVGFGNSACEIAICLHEHHAFPALSVRSAVNILPRDIAGIPVVSIAIAQQFITKISPRLTDLINIPVLRLINGNLEKSGLKKLPYGPLEQIVKYKKIPLIDIGTLALVKKNKIKIFPAIQAITSDCVEFTNGMKDDFDAIIFATGYEPGLENFLKDCPSISNASCLPGHTSLQNLYLCGFNISATGMLREIGIEARKIVKDLCKRNA